MKSMKSMEGRCGAIRGCSQLGLRKEKTKKVCGLSSLPDEVVLTCLAPLSRLDLAAFGMTSKANRSLVGSPDLYNLRKSMSCLESFLYVCLRILPEPIPRWFILHPVERRLKPVNTDSCQPQELSSSYVTMDWGIYIIGGLVNGKPTSDVLLFDCFEHIWYNAPPMKMARAYASACRIDMKIYVFGGCEAADSSNWAELYDVVSKTWEFLCVSPPLPKNIKQIAVIDDKEVCGVDVDAQSFSFFPNKLPLMFVSSGKKDSKPGDRDDWCSIAGVLLCRGAHGSILWCMPDDLDWKEVKGLKEHLGQCDIIKLCMNIATSNIVIFFWNDQPQGGAESLELWSAEISVGENAQREVCGKIMWSGAIFKLDHPPDSSNSVKVLFAASLFA